MAIPGSVIPLLMRRPPAAADDESYTVDNSVRFEEDDTAYLSFTPRAFTLLDTYGAGNRRRWTWAAWVKRTQLGSNQAIFTAKKAGTNSRDSIRWDADNTLLFDLNDLNDATLRTTQVFRDVGAFGHLCVAVDTTQATTTDRVKIYWNGKRITTFSTANYPAQNYQCNFNSKEIHGIGTHIASPQQYLNGYIADVHFIDNLQLSPAAFGKFSASGSWDPKVFARPTPNAGITWSDGGSGSTNAGSGFDKMFDGEPSTYMNGSGAWSQELTLTFSPALTVQSVEVNVGTLASQYKINDGTFQTVTDNGGYHSLNFNGTLTTLTIKGDQSTNAAPRCEGIKIDGVELIDGKTDPSARVNPNNGQRWSWTTTNSQYSGYSKHAAWDGNIVVNNSDTAWSPATNSTNTWTGHVPVVKEVRIYCYAYGLDSSKYEGFEVNDVAQTPSLGGGHWHTVTGINWDSNDLTEIEIGRNSADSKATHIAAVEVDGHILLNCAFDNSYRLAFGDKTNSLTVGRDSLVRLSDTTIGLPIYKTDESGAVKDSPTAYRDDPHAAYLQLAIPGDSVASGTCDVHQQINTGSSNRAATVTGAVVKTDAGGHYNAALYFDGSDDKITFANDADICDMGSGDFTWECWYKPSSLGQTFSSVLLMGLYNDASVSNNRAPYLYVAGSAPRFGFKDTSGGGAWIELGTNVVAAHDEWHHVAAVRHGTKLTLYLNGCRHDEEGLFEGDNNPSNIGTTTARSNSTEPFCVGGSNVSPLKYRGYLQDVRVYKGVAKYTEEFIPPYRNNWSVNNIDHGAGGTQVADATGAQPIYNTTGSPDYGETKGTGTRTDSLSAHIVLALPFSDSGDSDSTTWKDYHADIKGSGSAQSVTRTGSGIAYSTAQSYFYGASTLFSSGSGNSINIPYGSDFDFTSDQDHCIEGWIYHTANVSGGAGIWSQGTSGGFQLNINVIQHGGYPGYCLNYETPGTRVRSDSALPLNTWVHFACVSDGGTQYMYVDGVQQSITGTNNVGTSDTVYMGRQVHDAGSYGWAGHIQDIRVYRHKKYSGNFTPPARGAVENQDILRDSPTNHGTEAQAGGEVSGNYCVLNPLDFVATDSSTLTQGNLTFTGPASASNWAYAAGTLAISSDDSDGFYYEATVEAEVSDVPIGFLDADVTGLKDGRLNTQYVIGHSSANNSFGVVFISNGYVANYGTLSSGAGPTWNSGDIIQIAIKDNKIWIGVNNTWHGSGVGGGGFDSSNPTVSLSAAKRLRPCINLLGDGTNRAIVHLNAGQRAFKHTAPSGFKCICTANIPDTFSGDEVNNPSKFFDTTVWTGDGSSPRTIDMRDGDFTPDLVWLKNRSTAGRSHYVYDSIRTFAANKEIVPNANNEEGSSGHATDESGYVSGVGAGEFTVGAGSVNQEYTNKDGNAFVAWLWKAETAFSNGAGTNGATVASTGRYNADAGFAIVEYTGGGYAAGTGVYHPLGAIPQIVLHKRTDGTSNWEWYTTLIDGSYDQLMLNEDDDKTDNAQSVPTSTLFNSTWASGQESIAYLWTPKKGYSSFGFYQGGSDPTFVHTGFRPRFVMIKVTSHDDSWIIYDSVRNFYNASDDFLQANNNEIEILGNANKIDILSNGFAVRGAQNGTAGSSRTYIYTAFAEVPHKTARAR